MQQQHTEKQNSHWELKVVLELLSGLFLASVPQASSRATLDSRIKLAYIYQKKKKTLSWAEMSHVLLMTDCEFTAEQYDLALD